MSFGLRKPVSTILGLFFFLECLSGPLGPSIVFAAEEKGCSTEGSFMEPGCQVPQTGALPTKSMEQPGERKRRGGKIVCAMDMKTCPDGSLVRRIPPSCQFKPCPNSQGKANSNAKPKKKFSEAAAGSRIQPAPKEAQKTPEPEKPE